MRRDTSSNIVTPLLSTSKRSSVTAETESKDYLVIYSPPRLSETVGTSTTPPQGNNEGVIKSKYENQPRRKSTIGTSVSSSSVVSADVKGLKDKNEIKRINTINRRKSASDNIDQSLIRKVVVNRRNSLVTSPSNKTKHVNDNSLDTSSLLKKYNFINDDVDNYQEYEDREFNDDSVLNADESMNSAHSTTFYPSFSANVSNNARKGSVRKSFVNLSVDTDSEYEGSELNELSPVQATSKRPLAHNTAIKSKNVETSTNTSP